MILSHFEGNCLQIRKIEERTGETIEGITACDTDLNHIPDQISNYVIGRRGEQLTKRIIFLTPYGKPYQVVYASLRKDGCETGFYQGQGNGACSFEGALAESIRKETMIIMDEFHSRRRDLTQRYITKISTAVDEILDQSQ